MAEKVTQSFYKYSVNGIKYYDLLPDYNVDKSLQKVTNPQEVKDYVTYLKSLGTYRPGDRTGVQYDAQSIAKDMEELISRYTANPYSEFVIGPDGSFTTQRQLDETAANEAAVAAGTMRRIQIGGGVGYIPIGSAGDVALKGGSFADQLKTPTATKPGVVPIDPNAIPKSTNFGNTTAGDTTPKTYTVPDGSNLTFAAKAMGITLEQLLDANPEYKANPNFVKAGAILKFPGSSSGANLSGTGTIDPNKQKELDITKQINDLMAKEIELLQGSLNKVDLSDSATLTKKLTEALTGTGSGGAPTVPSFENKFNQERNNLGVSALETKLNDLDAVIKSDDAAYYSSLSAEEQKLLSMGEISRNKNEKTLAYEAKRRDMIAERDSIARSLDQKYAVLENVMKYAGLDYANAKASYDTKFTQTLQLANLLGDVEDREKGDARANLTVMYNLLRDGNLDYSKLDASTKADIKNMELAAGLPVGFMQFIKATVDAPVTNFLSAYTDASGNRVQPVGTIDKTTGAFKIQNVVLPGGTDGGGSDSAYKKQIDWANARQFIKDNPDATYDALSNGIKENTALSDSDVKALLKEQNKVEGGVFLNRDWFVSTYGEEALIKKAKEAGYGRWLQSGQTEMENYLNDIVKGIEARRKLGMSDLDILKEMQK